MSRRVVVLRVFLAGPNDVRKELDMVNAAVSEVNRGIGAEKGIQLEVVSWRTHAVPGMGRTEQVILDQIKPEDIFIGVMWRRAGTPSGEFASGTIEEFDMAFRFWKESGGELGGKPRILFYFCDRPFTISDSEELEQLSRLVRFRDDTTQRGLVCRFKNRTQFADMVRQHLTTIVRQWRIVPPERDIGKVVSRPVDKRWLGCTALLAADIQGFERLNVELTSQRCDVICDLYQRVGRQAIGQSNGVLLSGVGDHLWAVFEKASDALRAGLELLRQVQDPKLGVSAHELPIRVALQTSKAIATASDPSVVYREARLATALAGLTVGGHIVASATFLNQYTAVDGTSLEPTFMLHWHNHGPVEVGGYGEAVDLYEVIDVEAGVQAVPLRGRLRGKKTITWMAS